MSDNPTVDAVLAFLDGALYPLSASDALDVLDDLSRIIPERAEEAFSKILKDMS